MSQTTSSRLRGLSFSAAALRAKPDLAAQLAVIVNEWSIVEGMACQILAMLLPGSDHPELFGSRVDAATAMLRRVHNFSLRLDIIQAAAKSMLSKSDFDPIALNLVQNALNEAGKAEKERNKIAHKLFGTCENYPDALIGVDYEDMLYGQSNLASASKPPRKHDYPCMIFSRKYLDTIEDRMATAKGEMLDALLGLCIHQDALLSLRRTNEPGPQTAEVSDPPAPQGTPSEPGR